MGEVTIRLNRLGLEQGRMWPALVAAVAIVLPVAVWTGLERLVGDTAEDLEPGQTITLQSYPVPEVELWFEPPGSGWSVEPSIIGNRAVLNRGRITATVQVDSGVESLRTLLERRADRLTATQPGTAVTNIRRYRDDAGGLEGFRADLYGRNIAGSIVVVGDGSDSAATLILLSPLRQRDDGSADADAFVAGFRFAEGP